MPSERYAAPALPPKAINEKHGLAVLACDRSGSVSPYINEINQGLHDFGDVMKANHKSASVIDVELLSFADDVTCEVGFRPAAEYVAPTLRTSGCTAFNQAIIAAMKDIRKRKDYYKSVGISYWRPFLFVFSDGLPTDSEYEAEAKQMLQEAYDNKGVTLYVMAVGNDADVEHLRSYLPGGKGKVLKCSPTDVSEALIWYSSSMVNLSVSDPSLEHMQSVPLPACVTTC